MDKTIKVILLLIFTAQFIFATDYYVSSSSGNNNNDGLTSATAWKTLSKVYSYSFQPGDVIHFKRGDVWYNQSLFIRYSGAAGNPITYTDYGEGNKPEISGMGTLTNTAEWTNEGNNIWSIKIDETLVPNWNSFYRLQRLYINGDEVLGAAVNIPNEIGRNVPDPVRFHYDQSTQTLKLFSDVNPDSLKIEFAFHQYALYFAWWANPNNQIEYVNIENLKFSGGNNACIKIVSGNYITLTNLDIGDKGNYGLYINGDDNASHDVIIDNCTFDSRYHFDYSQAGTMEGTSNRGPREGFYGRWSDNVEIYNSIFNNFTHANINLQQYADGKYCENYSIHDNYSTCSLAYGGRTVVDIGTYNLEFYNNIIDGSGVQNQLQGQNCHYHHNIIKDVKTSPLKHYHSGFGISVYPYAGEDVINNIYENNLIMNCESGGISIVNYKNNNSSNVIENCIFRNNMLINNGKYVSHFTEYPQNQTSNIDLAIKISDPYDWDNSEFINPVTSNNIFQNNLFYVDSSQITSNGSARILYHLDDNDPNGWTTPSISVNQFNNKNGQNNDIITDNIEGNPLFVDMINGDYHLQSASPAIDAGTTPLATKDFEGNPIPYAETLPDIGIYEYSPFTNINLDESDVLNKFSLYQNYPNPFNPTTTIKYAIPKTPLNPPFAKGGKTGGVVTLKVYDVLGREVTTLVNAKQSPGTYTVTFEATNLPSGIYFYRLKAGDYLKTRKMILLR